MPDWLLRDIRASCGVQEIGRVSSFTPVTECGACRQRQMHGQVTMQTRGSRFVKVSADTGADGQRHELCGKLNIASRLFLSSPCRMAPTVSGAAGTRAARPGVCKAAAPVPSQSFIQSLRRKLTDPGHCRCPWATSLAPWWCTAAATRLGCAGPVTWSPSPASSSPQNTWCVRRADPSQNLLTHV